MVNVIICDDNDKDRSNVLEIVDNFIKNLLLQKKYCKIKSFSI